MITSSRTATTFLNIYVEYLVIYVCFSWILKIINETKNQHSAKKSWQLQTANTELHQLYQWTNFSSRHVEMSVLKKHCCVLKPEHIRASQPNQFNSFLLTVQRPYVSPRSFTPALVPNFCSLFNLALKVVEVFLSNCKYWFRQCDILSQQALWHQMVCVCIRVCVHFPVVTDFGLTPFSVFFLPIRCNLCESMFI